MQYHKLILCFHKLFETVEAFFLKLRKRIVFFFVFSFVFELATSSILRGRNFRATYLSTIFRTDSRSIVSPKLETGVRALALVSWNARCCSPAKSRYSTACRTRRSARPKRIIEIDFLRGFFACARSPAISRTVSRTRHNKIVRVTKRSAMPNGVRHGRANREFATRYQ